MFRKPDENPFLKDFYLDSEKHAFTTQIHFVMQRSQQINKYFSDELIDKKIISEQTLDFIKNFKINEIDGTDADSAILDFIKENRCIVATMDKELKNKIKQLGGSILSVHNDKIVLEN